MPCGHTTHAPISVARVRLSDGTAADRTAASLEKLWVGHYELVRDRVVFEKVHELTYKATLVNAGPDIKGAIAVAKAGPKLTVVDGSLTFPATRSGGRSMSADTFTRPEPRRPQIHMVGHQVDRYTALESAADRRRRPDQTVAVGETVTLNGSGWTDRDGDALTYRWRISSRPAGQRRGAQRSSAVTRLSSRIVPVPTSCG